MTELPERIWACMGGPMVGLFVSGGNNGGWPEYVRADAIESLTAERDEAWAYMSALQGDLYDAVMIEAERDRLRAALTVLHKQALMLRGEQSYREFARAVEKQARAALKGETP